MPMDWDKLRIFHAVAEAGSFTHAGEKLKLSQSAVSRQIGALEESVKAPLFHRHARGLVLTEQGEVLFRTVREMAAKLATAEALLTENKDRPQGPLRVTTTVGLGSTWLAPRLRELVERYPEIAISLILDDVELDLTMREADVAIRMATPRQPDLIQRHLMTVHFHVYAAPGYLKKYGTPKSLPDLAGHRLVLYGDQVQQPFADVNWLEAAINGDNGGEVASFKVNSVYGMFRATQSGIGIASLPGYMIQKDSGLVRILPELAGPVLECYFVYPEALRNSTRVTVFRDFLLRQIAETDF